MLTEAMQSPKFSWKADDLLELLRYIMQLSLIKEQHYTSASIRRGSTKTKVQVCPKHRKTAQKCVSGASSTTTTADGFIDKQSVGVQNDKSCPYILLDVGYWTRSG